MSSSAVSPFRRSNSFLAVRTPTTSSTLGMVSVKEKGSHDDLDDDHYVEDVENYNGGMSYTSQTGNKTGMFSLSSRLPNLLGTTSTATTNNSDNTDQQIETSPNHNGSSNGGGTSSLLGSTFNLSKTIVGAGFLSLPYGIASFADNSLAIIPSLLLLMSIGWIAIYSFKSIGRACEMYHAKSFAEVWSRVVDNKTSRLLPLIIVIKTLLGCLAFSIVISDLLVGICGRFDCPIIFMNRNIVLVVVTTFVLYPLACMKKLDALKYSSAIGLVATIYCAVFIMIRYCDRSYQEGGRYFRDIDKHLQPFFSSATHPTQVTNTGSYILVSHSYFLCK